MGNPVKFFGTVLSGAVSAAFNDVLPLAILALLFVVADCVSAFRLSRRVHKKGCNDGKRGSCGKFKSHKVRKTVLELAVVIPSGLMMSFWTQEYLFDGLDVRLPEIFAGIVIFWQLYSILENESSCNDAKWAKVLQKIMIDKTERHFDVDLSILREKEDESKQ
jgi:hypothetical protein